MDTAALAEAMGNSPGVNYASKLAAVNQCLTQANCTTVERAAMLLAQVGHESSGLRYMHEIASGAAYEGRRDLGNTQPGDGQRFRGHGPLQITGRANHLAVSKWAHGKGLVPTPTYFVDHPDELAGDRYGFLGVVWYWTVARPNLNALSDARDINGATRMVNGGTNGLADRTTRWRRCLAMGARILPTEGGEMPKTVEKVLDYSRAEIGQDTYYWCGPATTQTLIQARTGQMVPEATLAKELGTTVNGTNGVIQLARVLNARIGGEWKTGSMPNDPPHAEEKEQLWKRIVASVNGGVGVAANIWVPPNNYPKASYKSTENLRYGGGFVMHYLAVMGYARDSGGTRHVWLADSGFKPHGSWVTFDQFATMIPPREYAWASAWATDTSEGEEDMGLTKEEHDALMDVRAMLMTLSAQDMGDPKKTGPFGGWNHADIMASVKDKRAAGKDITRTEQLHVILDMLGFYKEEK